MVTDIVVVPPPLGSQLRSPMGWARTSLGSINSDTAKGLANNPIAGLQQATVVWLQERLRRSSSCRAAGPSRAMARGGFALHGPSLLSPSACWARRPSRCREAIAVDGEARIAFAIAMGHISEERLKGKGCPTFQKLHDTSRQTVRHVRAPCCDLNVWLVCRGFAAWKKTKKPMGVVQADLRCSRDELACRRMQLSGTP